MPTASDEYTALSDKLDSETYDVPLWKRIVGDLNAGRTSIAHEAQQLGCRGRDLADALAMKLKAAQVLASVLRPPSYVDVLSYLMATSQMPLVQRYTTLVLHQERSP